MKQRITKKERFLAMGEIMLRLTPPDCEKSEMQQVLKQSMVEVKQI